MTHSTTTELKAKLDDLALLEDELAATKIDLRERDSMVRDLAKENEQLRHQIAELSRERDTLRAYARNLTAKLRVVSENITSIICEASRSAVSEVARVGRRPERPTQRAMQTMAEGFRRQAALSAEPEPQEPTDYAPAAMMNRLPNGTRPPNNEFRA